MITTKRRFVRLVQVSLMGQAMRLGQIDDNGQVIYYVCDSIHGTVIASDSSIEKIAKRFEIIQEGARVEFIDEQPSTIKQSKRNFK